MLLPPPVETRPSARRAEEVLPSASLPLPGRHLLQQASQLLLDTRLLLDNRLLGAE